MKTIGLIALAVALVPSLAAQKESQPPPPSLRKGSQDKQKQGTSKQEQVRADENQGKSGPLLLQQYYMQPESGNETKRENDSNHHPLIEAINAASAVLLAIFTLLLAITTAVLCRIAWLQRETMVEHKASFEAIARNMETGLVETTKAANAATKAAEAAERNTDVLVNIQRAWVVVSQIHRLAPRARPHQNVFCFNLKNMGSTVARVMNMRRTHIFLKDGEQLPDIPYYTEPPDSDPPEYGRVLAPGEEITNIPVYPQGYLTEPEVGKVESGDIIIGAHASIEYFDVSDKKRKLRFAYIYSRDQNNRRPETSDCIMYGPEEYNKHT